MGPPCLSGLSVVGHWKWNCLSSEAPTPSWSNRWRTKQNLDYCFLMMYAQSKGIYYVQVSLWLFSCPP